jgi:hypothetical protein
MSCFSSPEKAFWARYPSQGNRLKVSAKAPNLRLFTMMDTQKCSDPRTIPVRHCAMSQVMKRRAYQN